MIENLSAMQETQVWSLGQKDPLEKGMATHFNILAWRIPWTAKPDGLKSMGSQRVRHNWAYNSFFEERNGNLLQYSCLENSMDIGAWRATVHGVAESDTTECTHTIIQEYDKGLEMIYILISAHVFNILFQLCKCVEVSLNTHVHRKWIYIYIYIFTSKYSSIYIYVCIYTYRLVYPYALHFILPRTNHLDFNK